MHRIVAIACALFCVTFASHADAQQAFTFSLADAPDAVQTARAPLAVFAGKQLDPMSGVEIAVGRFTIAALEDSRFLRLDPRHSRQAELLVNVWRSGSGARFTIGGGVRRDSNGSNVALGRAIVETPAFAGHLVANVNFERATVTGRDAVDMMTTVAYSRRVSRVAFVGLETLLQDVEGFWDPTEADGGARLFIGPSLDVVAPRRDWQLHVTAGRDMRATNSARVSDAFRPLGQSGTVVRVSASHRF